MGEYCTVRDVRVALTPNGVGDNSGTAAELEDWQIENAITEAEGVVSSYIASRYTIYSEEVEELNPEDPEEVWLSVVAPEPVRSWTRNIAAYLAALTYRRNKDLTEDDPIRLRYTHTMENLVAVRDGRMDLDLPGTEVDTSGVHVENLYTGDLFGLEDVGLGYAGSGQAQRYWPYRDDVM